ncbi:hypothetical protein N7536_000123 [Penicillium majusculum]|nr:hypothetical protein N7536_000123 [Penicillium majusculum]
MWFLWYKRVRLSNEGLLESFNRKFLNSQRHGSQGIQRIPYRVSKEDKLNRFSEAADEQEINPFMEHGSCHFLQESVVSANAGGLATTGSWVFAFGMDTKLEEYCLSCQTRP